jgi:hypothetical protein
MITQRNTTSRNTALKAIREGHSYVVKLVLGWWNSLGERMPLQGFGAARLKDDPFGWQKAMLPLTVRTADVRTRP